MANPLRRATALCLLPLLGCHEQPSAPPLGTLERTVQLPHRLREISGIALHHDNVHADHLLGIQDEVGSLFEIDADGKVVSRREFGPKADYEDLAIVGATIYVLRSDGVILVVEGDDELAVTATLEVGAPGHEYESLAFDEPRGRLLFTPKVDAKSLLDDRVIFAMDLSTGKVVDEPALRLSVAAVEARANQLGVPLPERKGGRGNRPAVTLRITALAMQPGRNRLWALSADDQLLVAAALDGRIERVFRIDGLGLPQPEGLCFAGPDVLWIASESDGGIAKLCAFRLADDR